MCVMVQENSKRKELIRLFIASFRKMILLLTIDFDTRINLARCDLYLEIHHIGSAPDDYTNI